MPRKVDGPVDGISLLRQVKLVLGIIIALGQYWDGRGVISTPASAPSFDEDGGESEEQGLASEWQQHGSC